MTIRTLSTMHSFPNMDKMSFEVALLNRFKLSEAHRNLLAGHYLLNWEAQYLLTKLNDDGTLTHAGVTYIPIWKLDVGTLHQRQQVHLSFRKFNQIEPIHNFAIYRNYVLIKAGKQ